ncbi:MAG: OmpA family protein [Candidatus Dactylopiibacterium sp.]|nr:OmpA family protein [Candidatus Dactylopiibacterium sp.]
MTTRYSFPAIFVWAASLALMLLLLTPAVWSGWLIAASAVAAVWAWATWRARHAATSTEPTPYGLPREGGEACHALPVVLWCLTGDVPPGARQMVRDAHALWLGVESPSALAGAVDSVRQWRGRAPDAIALVVAPGTMADGPASFGNLSAWRQAVQDAVRHAGTRMPVWLVLCAPQPGTDAGWHGRAAAPAWRGLAHAGGQRPMKLTTGLEEVAALLDAPGRVHPAEAGLDRDIRMQAVVRWATSMLCPLFEHALKGHAPLRFQGILVGEHGACDPHGLLAQWLAQHSTLRCASHGTPTQPGAGPQALAGNLTPPGLRPAWARAALHAIVMGCLALMVALLASFHNNRDLLRGVDRDLRAYAAAGPGHDAARLTALGRLRQDADMLASHAREGVPWRLGWGLYRGDRLLPRVEEAISTYQPPPREPSVITLDSLALFASGASRLRPDADRALVGALMQIARHPDKRVLIAGHTDDTGSGPANLALSEARAAAVRDRFVAMSGLPASHFAIQGYGDTRPLAANDSAVNRARNRRVEITLVPDLPAH